MDFNPLVCLTLPYEATFYCTCSANYFQLQVSSEFFSVLQSPRIDLRYNDYGFRLDGGLNNNAPELNTP